MDEAAAILGNVRTRPAAATRPGANRGVWRLLHRMDAEDAHPPSDRRIAELAARQHGVVARRQLAALGLGEGRSRSGLRAGRLHRVHRGVYAVGHPSCPAMGG